MQPVIYIDMLFLINALLGYFLLRGVGALCRIPPNLIRIVLSSILAGFSSFIILLPSLPWWAALLYNFAVSAVICACAFRFISYRMLFRSMFWYLALNIALAGIILAAVYYLGASGISLNNMAVYFDISPLVLLLCVVVTYLGVKLSGLFFAPVSADEKAYITFDCKGMPCSCAALVDTGFNVKDMSGKQTFLVSLNALKGQLLPSLYNDLQSYLNGGAPVDNIFAVVCINTVSGYKALPSVKVSKVCIRHKKQKIMLEEAAAIFSAQPVGDGSFDAIIGAQNLT